MHAIDPIDDPITYHLAHDDPSSLLLNGFCQCATADEDEEEDDDEDWWDGDSELDDDNCDDDDWDDDDWDDDDSELDAAAPLHGRLSRAYRVVSFSDPADDRFEFALVDPRGRVLSRSGFRKPLELKQRELQQAFDLGAASADS